MYNNLNLAGFLHVTHMQDGNLKFGHNTRQCLFSAQVGFTQVYKVWDLLSVDMSRNTIWNHCFGLMTTNFTMSLFSATVLFK